MSDITPLRRYIAVNPALLKDEKFCRHITITEIGCQKRLTVCDGTCQNFPKRYPKHIEDTMTNWHLGNLARCFTDNVLNSMKQFYGSNNPRIQGIAHLQDDYDNFDLEDVAVLSAIGTHGLQPERPNGYIYAVPARVLGAATHLISPPIPTVEVLVPRNGRMHLGETSSNPVPHDLLSSTENEFEHVIHRAVSQAIRSKGLILPPRSSSL